MRLKHHRTVFPRVQSCPSRFLSLWGGSLAICTMRLRLLLPPTPWPVRRPAPAPRPVNCTPVPAPTPWLVCCPAPAPRPVHPTTTFLLHGQIIPLLFSLPLAHPFSFHARQSLLPLPLWLHAPDNDRSVATWSGLSSRPLARQWSVFYKRSTPTRTVSTYSLV